MRFAVALALALTVTACRTAPTGPTTASNAAATPDYAATAADELAFLRADSEMVVGIDAAALRSSPLWRQYEAHVVDSLGADWNKLTTNCGFDPMRTVTRVTLATKGGQDQYTGILVIHGMPAQQTLDCIMKLDANARAKGNKKMTVTVDHGFITLQDKDGMRLVVTKLDASLLVVEAGRNADRTSLTAALASGAPLRSSPGFMKLFDRREAGAVAWGVLDSSRWLSTLKDQGIDSKTIDATLRVTDKLTAAVRFTMHDAASATSASTKVTAILDRVRGFVDKLDARTTNETLHVDLVVTDEQLRALVAMASAF